MIAALALALALVCWAPPAPGGRLAAADGAVAAGGTTGGAAGEPRARDGPSRVTHPKTTARLPAAGALARRLGLGAEDTRRWDRLLLDIAADIDLYAACTAAGLAPAVAAQIASEASREPLAGTWRTVASLLAVGAEPERAWEPMAAVPGLSDLAALAAGSAASGTRVATAAGRISGRLRRRAEDRATAAGERAGVLIAMPLTLCFLPAFFILGLTPVVLGLAGNILG